MKFKIKSKHKTRKPPRLEKILSRIHTVGNKHDSAEQIAKFIYRLDGYYNRVDAEKQSAIDIFNGNIAAGIHEKLGTVVTPSLMSAVISMHRLLRKSEDPQGYLESPLEYLEDVASLLTFPTKELLAFQNHIARETVQLFQTHKDELNLLAQHTGVPAQQIHQEMNITAEAPPPTVQAPQANQNDPFGDLFKSLRI